MNANFAGHWTDWASSHLTAQQMIEAATDKGKSLASHLEDEYRAICEENNNRGGYDPECYSGYDFEQFARQVESEAVENVRAGRPTLYGEKMTQTAVFFRGEQLAWLKAHTGKTMSEVMRDLVDQAMG